MGIFNSYQLKTGVIVVMIVWKLATQLPITTKAMSSNPVHGEVCSIQHYVIRFVSELRQVGGFLRGAPVSSSNKTDRQDITEILLKVALNIINLSHIHLQFENM